MDATNHFKNREYLKSLKLVSLSKNILYYLLTIACLAGYSWLYYSITSNNSNTDGFELCLIKQATNIPCPSCGATRSLISLAQGDFLGALYTNPYGLIIGFTLLIVPPWLIIDISMKRNSLYNTYQKIEFHLKKPQFYIPLIVLILINWIWNITKGL